MSDDLYDIARRITFEAGFPTWTDPRTMITHKNPKPAKKRKAKKRKKKA